MEPEIDSARHDEITLVREIARLPDKAALKKDYDRLILVAPPRTLGDLRALLPKHAMERIAGELGKDLVHLSKTELATHLADLVKL